MSVANTEAGQFVWHTLLTTDLSAAKQFYTGLFEWTATEMDMGPAGKYTMFRANGKDVAGAARADKASPSHWLPYVSVASVDASADRVQTLGGKLLVAPSDIPNVGRSCVVSDGQEAVLALFTRAPGTPAPSDAPAPVGHFCWRELFAKDVQKAVDFYTAVFGWNTAVHDMGPAGNYTMFKRGDQMVAGAVKVGPGARPSWLPYVLVNDVNASTDRARSLGATVKVAPVEIPGSGQYSTLVDPTGVAFALWTVKR